MEEFKNKIIHGDCLEKLKELESDSVDSIVTDPPYGYSFMGKDWDKAVPSVEVWQECLRVLKPGGFAFVMSAPRSDVCSRMCLRLEEAGFVISFTPIYWTYASGFPKAMNIGKMVDKRGGKDWTEQKQVAIYIRQAMKDCGYTAKQLNEVFNTVAKANHWIATDANNFCMPTKSDYFKLKEILHLDDRFDQLIEREEAQREVIGTKKGKALGSKKGFSTWQEEEQEYKTEWDITTAKTDQAKALEGSYGGFQPKPAVEVIIVAMKPLSEKTYVDQALKNRKGITWLDDCRVPTGESTIREIKNVNREWGGLKNPFTGGSESGRFPANLLCSDDVLNGEQEYSRYFDLDKWASTLPFLICAKASKGEKNRGLEHADVVARPQYTEAHAAPNRDGRESVLIKNHHPTVKPLKLMSYLITLGSRPGDTILDPFSGSCTTLVAAKELKRNYIGIERESEYVAICEARLEAVPSTLF